MDYSVKPWYSARWETVEPEPEDENALGNDVYNDPTVNELIDMEFGYEFSE